MRRDLASAEQLEWERTCSRAIQSDVIWKLDAYRSALYLLHVARPDVRVVAANRLYEDVAAQMIRVVGSVSANIGEGYSRPTRADRLRFLGYALGSVRECVTWYQGVYDVLDEGTIEARLILLARNRALLLGLIRSIRERGRPGADLEA